MRAITKLLAATAVALTAGALATSASAAAFVTVAGSTSNADNSVVWTPGSTAGTGTLSTVANTTEHINFNNLFFNDGGGEDATFIVSASASGPPDGQVVTLSGPTTFRQTGVSGFFEFLSISDPSVVLLRGDFTNAWISGTANSGSLMTVDPSSGGSLTFTSDVATINGVTDPSATLSFSGASPAFGVTTLNAAHGGGQVLNKFTATGVSGTFSAAIPEPATWALMIGGFGGAGVMLRRQRRQAVAA